MRCLYPLLFGCLWLGRLVLAGPPALAPGVAATVNGKPIQISSVEATLRKDIEPELHNLIRQQHLQRMVLWAIVEQELAGRGLSVADKDVDQEAARLAKTPPLMGCGCCGFTSLDEYLQVNRMSDDDLRLDIKRDLGMGLLVQDEWKRKHADATGNVATTSEEGERYRKQYRKVWQIFTAAPEEVPHTPASEEKSKLARQRMQQAMDELYKGKSFQDVAKACSEDKSTAAKGGLVGYMPIDQPLLALLDSKRWPSLELRKVQGPYRSWVGYHIVWIETLSDDDVRAIMKSDYEAKAADEIWGQLITKSHVEPAVLLQR